MTEETKKPIEGENLPPEKDKDVKIPKKTLDAILEKLEQSEAREKKRDEEIEMLKSVADKSRLGKWEEQNKGALIRTAKVSFWEGSPILAWAKVKDEVGFREGRLIVNQIIKLFLDIGEKEPKEVEIPYHYWSQNVNGEVGEVINKNSGKNGEIWTIELKDGRKVDLDIRFLNAF